jgi:hypothetical protein
MRKLKVVGAAMVAVLAVTAMAASAQAKTFHSDINTTFLLGTQAESNVFTTKAGTVKCSTATFTGEITGTSVEKATVTPAYGTCKAFGQNATVTSSGCQYVLNANGSIEKIQGCLNGAYGGFVIDVPTGECTVKVPNQTPGTTTIDYTNEELKEGTAEQKTNSKDILVRSTVAQIKYEVVGPGTICGTAGTYEGANGASYSGTVTTKGYENEAHTIQRGIWVE